MPGVIQFVDSIAASPTVRLAMNDRTAGIMFQRNGIDFSPPEYRRTEVSSMLADGNFIAASSYGNRVLKIPIYMLFSTADAAATALQNLARELARPNNILKVQLDGTSSPVFFRTYAAPNYTFSMLRLLLKPKVEVTLEIPAEPFAYGIEEVVSAVTVNDDPAAGSNAMSWDMTGVKGDVETPLNLVLPTSDLYDSGDPISILAVRRRNLGAVPFVLQAETGTTLGTDTTLPGNDAVMSGSGSNYARCSFSTNTSMVRRVYLDPYPTSASIDNRGRYRVIACVRRSSATGAINAQLGFTNSAAGILVQNDPVVVPLTTNRQHIDLGLITYPTGLDPVYQGYSNVEYPVRGRYLEVRAERVSGSSNLDFDYFLFVPADETMALIDWGEAILTTNEFYVDSVHRMVFPQNTPQDQVYGARPTAVAGGFPMITPGVTNRIYFIRRVGRGALATKSATTAIEMRYWPRYLTVRPATT